MIHSRRFVIAHMGKTGGDAAKQITAALGLPHVTCHLGADPRKHFAPWQLLDMRGRDLILTIRRLPAREISWYHQQVQYDGLRPLRRKDIPGWLVQRNNGEREIRRMTGRGEYQVRWYVRSENLLDDLLEVYRHYFEITPEQAARAVAAKTKPRLRYNHDLSRWLTQDDIDALYAASPTWSMHELKAYGSLATLS